MPEDYSKLKETLSEMLRKKKEDKANEDTLRQAKNDGDRNKILENIAGDLTTSLQPVLADLAKNSKLSTDDIRQALTEAIHIQMPEITVPPVTIPAPIVNIPAPVVHVPAPVVNVPAPIVNIPEGKDHMVKYTNKNPFPVMMMDGGGKPMVFPTVGSAGPGFPMQTLDVANNAIRVSGSFSISASNSSTQAIDSSGNPYTQANPFPVVFGSSGTTATNIIDSSGVAYSGSNPLPTTATITLPFGPGDAATATRFIQAGDSVSSVVVNSGTITTVTTVTGITNTLATANIDSSGVQYSGSNPIPVYLASGTGASTAVVVLDRDGNPQTQSAIAQGDAASALRVVIAGNTDASVVVNSGTITTVTTVTNITNSIAALNVDSSGVGYSGSNPFPVALVGGGLDSMFVHIARTTNPTAVSDGADIRPSTDKLGRQLIRPINARELIATAYVTLSTGTEATLLTATAGQYIDLISIIAANTSSVAQQLDIRATTAGNIVQTLYIPANATAGWAPTAPWPQDSTGNSWTVDMADFTNSNILISALFSKEI